MEIFLFGLGIYFLRINFLSTFTFILTFVFQDVKVAKNILNIEPGHQVVVIGTLYKDMPLKPNILDDYHAQEVRFLLLLFFI